MPPIDPEESSSGGEVPVAAATTTPKRGKKATRATDAMSEDEAAVPLRKTPRREAKAAAATTDDPMDEDKAGENGEAEKADDGDVDMDEDEEGDDEEEEYVVEKIVDHKWDAAGSCLYLVKWKGYEKKSDQTWEPIEHLQTGAKEVLQEYYAKIGGKPVKPTTGKRGRQSQSAQTPPSTAKGRGRRGGGAESTANTPAAAPAAAPASAAATTAASTAASNTSGPTSRANNNSNNNSNSNNKWAPPTGSWEDEILNVDTIEQDDKGLHVYLQWNNGRKSKHPIEQTYKKCPQKMLHFYEQHLIFKDGSNEAAPAPNGTG